MGVHFLGQGKVREFYQKYLKSPGILPEILEKGWNFTHNTGKVREF